MAGIPEEHAKALLQRRLQRPVGHLRPLATLGEEPRAALSAAIAQATEQRRATLDRDLRRVLPWPLRALLLRGLGR
ncbi:hypothetical protein [Panacagrimonas sp.]|uniref:hypothetical protein n=1 Tax=Panacagrimonas sp. TaxID=2480088 RepID=UPI003B5286D0